MNIADTAEALANKEYLRQRFEPRQGDVHYVVLSDLLLALQSLIPSDARRVLDYGSGGSPYIRLFGNCEYHRADLKGAGLDFNFGADSRLPPSVGGYDVVLSSQVLEHVDEPTTYLQECYRVLSPEGTLLLTTHGMFEDHSCPNDFWRWTPMGLQKMIEAAGFRVEVTKKITTGPRAALFYAEHQFHQFRVSAAGPYARLLAFFARVVQKIGPHRLHAASDASFKECRVVDATAAGHNVYVGIAVRAIRK